MFNADRLCSGLYFYSNSTGIQICCRPPQTHKQFYYYRFFPPKVPSFVHKTARQPNIFVDKFRVCAKFPSDHYYISVLDKSESDRV